MMDLAITILKLLATAIAAALGILGVLYDFRDKKSMNLTPAGIAVVVGIAVSGIVGVASSMVEAYREKASSAQQQERTEALLKQVSRAIQPISKLEATYWMCFCGQNAHVKAYAAELSKAIDERLAALRSRRMTGAPDERVKGINVVVTSWEGDPWTVQITKESQLWPSGEHKSIADFAQSFLFSVYMRNKPEDPKKLHFMGGTNEYWDISTAAMPAQVDVVLEWDLRTKKLGFVGTTNIPPVLWSSNGRVASFEDLYGAQMVLLVHNLKRVKLPEWISHPGAKTDIAFADSLSIKMIGWRVSETRSFLIVGKHWKATEFGDGNTAFTAILPKDEAGFRDLVREE